jgi:hypothetical protein
MKRLLYIFITIGVFIFILIGYYVIKFGHKDKIVDETRVVFIKNTDKGFQLYRNGKPFYIRGASGNSHFKELADIGGNTIRIYDTINIKNILDEAQKNNIAVIVDLYMPKFNEGNNKYLNDEKNEILIKGIQNFIIKYRRHPALLMWNLGNELKYPLVFRKNNFINTFNDLINIIHKEDPDHPVSTTVFSMNEFYAIYINSPQLDVIGFNVFGAIKGLIAKLNNLSNFIEPVPYFISEWGCSGPWEQEKNIWAASYEPSSRKKNEQVKERYDAFLIPNRQCLGNLIFYWGQKQENTPTWFSIFDDEGRKSQTYYELKNLWNNKSSELDRIPQLRHILIDKKLAKDTLIYIANETKNAEVILTGEVDTTYRYKWEIYEEDWTYGTGAYSKKRKVKRIDGQFDHFEKNCVSFRVPSIEGPYRIFVYVYDRNGNFATANTPFYVLNPK